MELLYITELYLFYFMHNYILRARLVFFSFTEIPGSLVMQESRLLEARMSDVGRCILRDVTKVLEAVSMVMSKY